MILFHTDCKKNIVDISYMQSLNPSDAIIDRKLIWYGLPFLIFTIVAFVAKDTVLIHFGFSYDNATVAFFVALILIMLSKQSVPKVLMTMIDRDTIFFFMGLFIVIGALEHTGVIAWIGTSLVTLSHGNMSILLGLITMGSGILSTFIDNVPYNITMVSAIKAMASSGIVVYPLRWALNLGTSFGGAGSPIGSACSVVALGEAEKDHIHFNFLQYMKYAFPLVIINGIVTFALLYWKFIV